MVDRFTPHSSVSARKVLELRSLFNSNLDNVELEACLGNMITFMFSLQKEVDRTQRRIDEANAYLCSWLEYDGSDEE